MLRQPKRYLFVILTINLTFINTSPKQANSQNVSQNDVPLDRRYLKNIQTQQLKEQINKQQIANDQELDEYRKQRKEVTLQDGKTILQRIQPHKGISFMYRNMNPEEKTLYLSLTISNPKAIKQIGLEMYYYEDMENTKNKVKFTPQIPSEVQIQSRAPASMLYELNHQYELIQIYIVSNYLQEFTLSICLNHQQIILLPLDLKLPVKVHKGETVTFLINNDKHEQGIIQVSISRCDESTPSVGFSKTEQQLEEQELFYEIQGESERVYTSHLRVEYQENLYVKIVGDPSENSLIQIKCKHLSRNRKKLDVEETYVRAGDHGVLQYQLLTTKKAEITFKGLDCGINCRDKVQYSFVSSNSKSDLYRRMICPTSYFFTKHSKIIKTNLTKIGIKPAKGDNKISFKHIMQDSIMYVNVIAKHQKSRKQVYYKAIEIVTIWGQLGRLSTQFIVVLIGACIGFLIILVVVIKKQAKKGYQKIRTKKKVRIVK